MDIASWMRTSAERAAPIVVAVALLGSAIGLAASCSGGASSTTPRADAGRDAHADAEAAPETGAGGAADAASDADAAPACDPDPHTALVPKGWVRFPGLPCQCTVWLAPTQELMTPAPKWVQEPGGWLELDDPQAGDPYTTGVPHGDSYAGVQLIAYQRVLKPGGQENVVLDVHADRYIFDEVVAGADQYSGPCAASMDALGQGTVLHGAWVNASSLLTLSCLAATTVTSPIPTILRKRVDQGPGGWGAGGNVVGVSPTYTDNMDAFTLAPVQAYPKAWVSDGRILDRYSMFGWDSTLFFGVAILGSPPAEQYLTWDPARGTRALLGTGPGQTPARSICNLGTDGKTLVWTQLDSWDGQHWQTLRLMQAPYATTSSNLKPQLVRTSPGADKCFGGHWIVGGGYAAAWVTLDDASKTHATFIVRLSDAAEWKLDTPGVYFFPLYLTATEMGALKAYDKPIPGGPDGYTGYRIARYPLSLLGAPNVP